MTLRTKSSGNLGRSRRMTDMGKRRSEAWWDRKQESMWEICNHCGLLRCPYCLPMDCPTWRAFGGKPKQGEKEREGVMD